MSLRIPSQGQLRLRAPRVRPRHPRTSTRLSLPPPAVRHQDRGGGVVQDQAGPQRVPGPEPAPAGAGGHAEAGAEGDGAAAAELAPADRAAPGAGAQAGGGAGRERGHTGLQSQRRAFSTVQRVSTRGGGGTDLGSSPFSPWFCLCLCFLFCKMMRSQNPPPRGLLRDIIPRVSSHRAQHTRSWKGVLVTILTNALPCSPRACGLCWGRCWS